jgi:hypothetical protein
MASLDEFAAKTTEKPSSNDTKSMPALWTILLNRIQDTAADTREEVRTGAISTLIRIFDNHGDDLSAEAWQLVFLRILLTLLKTDAESFPPATNAADQAEAKGRITTSKLALEGVAKLLTT